MIHLLHCADLHLDSPFSGLTPEQAAGRRRLQRQLPQKIVELSNRLHCDLILCSGDAFDGERVCPETLEALRSAFARSEAPIFVAPGNHDPYGERSPWARVSWPEQVHLFRGQQQSVMLPELGCRVWGAAFTAQDCYDDLSPVGESNLIELGVFHGDPQNQSAYRYLSKECIEASGLDYLALGHIHKTAMPYQVGKTWVGWPGVAMGRGFDETGIHGVFEVHVDKGTCEAKLLPMGGPRYEQLQIPAGKEFTLPADTKNWICRLTITGESEPLDLASYEQQLAPRFYALELRDETVPPLDLWADCGQDTLRGKALELLRREEDPQLAALAARYMLAALEGREEPC